MPKTTSLNCYCGANTPYSNCCQPKHLGKYSATTPEELMRSRFSAFCCCNVDYLLQTLHPSCQQNDDALVIQQTIDATDWGRLEVLHEEQKLHTGTVEFIAFFSRNSKPEQLHEKSNFILDEGRWYYTEGQQLPPIKLQRNDPCWCGSGQKLKKCCN